ncbi:MAG: methyl-accepting chemotaxis protein [Hydrogenovibrio sp.]|uniref:methyl-accepting chemotaxis protein n=1 Tax=Hydrogenovibrio sp. TaxID=2065821 RepID=UPI0028700958|nr:methyl-accepting chemotaxis protein [Hydrogenovibrio sp.]MDR9499319.1 methyl-accepting chemotaxis protein [Hydrogenovibrio sp.]
MTIKLRLIILSLVSFASIFLVVAISLWGENKLHSTIIDNNQLNEIEGLASFQEVLFNAHNQFVLTLQHDPANPEIVSMHDHQITMHFDNMQGLMTQAREQLAALKTHPASSRFRSDIEQLETQIENYFSMTEQGIDYYANGAFEQANHHFLTQMNPALASIMKHVRAFGERITSQSKQAQVEAAEFSDFLFKLIMISGLMFLGIISAISWMLTQSIRKGIQSSVNDVLDVASGMNFDRTLPARKDELGEVASALNKMFGAIKTSISETNQVVSAIAEGDFSKRVESHQKGDLDTLKQGVNASAASVDFMMNELSKIMTALGQGRFDVKMDEKVPEAFSQQVDDAMHSINTIMVEINDVMAAMNQGEFNHRVKVSAKGQLKELKDNVNQSIDSLESAIADIKRVVVAQSEGDLTQTIDNQYEGELAVLKKAINQSISALDDIVSITIETANTVATAADEVAQGSTDLSQRVQEQAASIEQSSATMEEFSAAVQNNAKSASDETEIEHQVESKANTAADVMSETIEAMTAIQDSSHKISEIVTLIDGIAFQTNLLALNAAVEAARAGEHGRGFAVVAGEVRALAQKSADAAKDITSLINESVKRIDHGTKLATESGEVIQEITQSIDSVTKMSDQISQSSAEQAKGVTQLETAISQIDEVTQQNAALVEQTSAAAESMQEQATRLSQRMSFFKTKR